MMQKIFILIILICFACKSETDTKSVRKSTIITDKGKNINLDSIIEGNYDIATMSAQRLKILRNEIYARNGYEFNSPELLKFYSQFSWYKPYTKNSDSLFRTMSEVDKKNIMYIKQLENIAIKNKSNHSGSQHLDTNYIFFTDTTEHIDTFSISNKRTPVLIKEYYETKAHKQLEISKLSYLIKIFELSDLDHPIKTISGIGTDMGKVRFYNETNTFYELTNFECCGGTNFKRIYKLKDDKLFLFYNDNKIIKLKIPDNEPLWILYSYKEWNDDWTNIIAENGYKYRPEQTQKRNGFIGSIQIANENEIFEIIDLFLDNQILESNHASEYYNLMETNLKLLNNNIHNKLYDFQIEFSFLDVNIIIEYKNNRFEKIIKSNNIKHEVREKSAL